MESPEGKPETFDETVDRLTMTCIARVSNTPGHSNNLWLKHWVEHANHVFDIQGDPKDALVQDSVQIGGVLETRRWIGDRVKLFLAGNHLQPVKYIARPICHICRYPMSVDFQVPDETWLTVVKQHWQDHVICISCFTRMGDEMLFPWEKGITFRAMSRITAQRLATDLNEVVSAELR